jgi:two-component system NtrC family sensor kinase
MVPQDIGRVVLNIFNNAFYSISRKKELLNASYEPVVSVTTKKVNHRIKITISDNGLGIAKKILDKIYQPFFTTKPAGEGIGLGLSLSYDIIKAYNGDLTVETAEGEFAKFIISIEPELTN